MTPPPVLFPPVEPFNSGHLPSQDGHEIYFEECGNPEGEPVLFLHGGPGSGASPAMRRFFDPVRFRAVLFDQRGAGRSRPHGSLEANTTPHLIADIERLRATLGIGRWNVFGGSWGATLATAYAMTHPERVHALVMYGFFLASEPELRRLYHSSGAAAALYPDVFEAFMAPLPESERDDPIAGYARLFESADRETRLDALLRWTALERAVSRFQPDDTALKAELSDADYVLAHSLIENHYFRHNGFIDAADILQHAGARLAGIPVHLVAARYDLVCPMAAAYEFAKAVPHATLEIVTAAGHTAHDPENTRAILNALANLPAMES